MSSKDKEDSPKKFPDRIRKSWVPLAAVAAAFTGFVTAAFRSRPEPAEKKIKTSRNAGRPAAAQPVLITAEPAPELKRRYARTSVIGGDASPHPFRRSLVDISIGPDDTLYCLGDDEIRIFNSDGTLLRSWNVKPKSGCLEVGTDGTVYIGSLGCVDVYSPNEEHAGSISVGDLKRPAAVTAIHIYENEILVADATAKIIRRYDATGKQLGLIGDKNKTGSFMLPNGWLDFDIDSSGIILATDTGRHRVTGWILDGTETGSFGKFGMQSPSDFVGCCNPVNLAVTPEGNIVTAEKMIARVKVFSPEGRLMAFIGPENFDQNCRNIHLAVDSEGRILAADPVERVIKIFSPAVQSSTAV